VLSKLDLCPAADAAAVAAAATALADGSPVHAVDALNGAAVDALRTYLRAGETHWAPEVIDDGERYRMYLTVIDGVFADWDHPRRIVEYVSDDLEHWTVVGEVPLDSDRVIDACVARCPDGRWRLWYKDEADDSTTWAAVSDDLSDWQVEGRAIGGRPHEGPNVFELGGWWWMLVDEWRGMGVHRSNDAVTWTRQGGADEVILGEPGHRRGDETFGRHGDVVVDGDRAVLYYFTHPHWDGSELGSSDAAAARLSAVFTALLSVVDDRLVCDRDAPIDRNPS